MAKALVFVSIGFILSQFFDKSASFLRVGNDLVVQMDEKGFRPQDITINQGETVIFKNIGKESHWPASNIHPTHEIYSEFDPKKPIVSGTSWSFRFEKEGEFRFHDHLNPRFTGNIITKEKKSTNSKSQSQNRSNIVWLDRISSIFNFSVTKNVKVNKKFSKPIPIDSRKLYKEMDFGCRNSDSSCIGNLLSDITKKYGPQTAIDILGFLQNDDKVARSIDDHQLAHKIGRQTSATSGYNAQSFLLCPMSSYNGGCQHGFFETALAQSQNYKEAVDLVCGSLDKSFSSKFKFYCYHGVGHGVMMAQAYNLSASLAICDSLSQQFAQDGCWQGVFMENVNGMMKGEVKSGIFSDKDPLAPCNVVKEKYRHECFINHSGRLMVYFENNIEKAANACLGAPKNYISSCLQTLGLLSTNPSWQTVILGKSDSPESVNVALEICDQFPESVRKDCFTGGIDNILNNDGIQLEKRALKLCIQLVGWDKQDCYHQIGINIFRQVVDINQRKDLCSLVEEGFEKSCLLGAGVLTKDVQK